MELKTTDLCDKHPDKVRIAEPVLMILAVLLISPAASILSNATKKLSGAKGTGVKRYRQSPRSRRGSSMRCALLGDMLGDLAILNKWNGIIVYGCVRDSAALALLPLGIKALDTIPLKSNKRNEGQENIAVHFAGVDFVPGEVVYCDSDGIIVSKEPLSL